MSEDKKKSVLSVVIYGAVLLIIAALLITMSIIINVRNTRRLENEVDITKENAQTRIMNVQEQNEQLKKAVDEAKTNIDKLSAQKDVLTEQAEIYEKRIESLDALASAGMYICKGRSSYRLAHEQLALVDEELLTDEELEAYEQMCKTTKFETPAEENE